MFRVACISIIATALPAVAAANIAERKTFSVTRVDVAPVIDGALNDAAWLLAEPVDDFHQTDPLDGAPATELTVVRAVYDEEYLYVGVDLRDSDPDGIRATQLIQGRQFGSDDRFLLTLDSFNNKRNDYFFQVNPNGIRREALRENNSRFIEEWDTIWHVESRVHDDGWSAEIAIPFKSISFDPATDTWGINFGRVIPRKQETAMWSSHERQDWPAYAGEMTGIEGIRQGLGLDVTPSLTVTDGMRFGGDAAIGIEPSLDLRYRITPSLNATLTVNTDFSTAEVDDRQIALDRFSLFFPEKRDFFLQDAGIFEFGNIDTNGRPFFSRRIGLGEGGTPVSLAGGGKLTGRVGDYSVGLLAIRQEEHADVGASDLLVARLSRNVLDQSSLGIIATHGDPGSDRSNTVVGTDFLFQDPDALFGNVLRGHAWIQKSHTEGLSGDDLAWGAHLETPGDRVRAIVSMLELQENFNPALGFVNRTGIREFEATARYRTRPETGPLRAINHVAQARFVTDLDGRQLSRELMLRPLTLFTHGTDLYVIEWRRSDERVLESFSLFDRLQVPAGRYSFDRYRFEVATGNHRPVNVVLSVQDGGFFGGERLEKFVEAEWRPTEHFSLGVAFEENDVDLPDGSFTTHLASLRTNVAFNADWSWSTLLQYDNTAERLGVNSRLRYVPEAGRELLLVLDHALDVDPDNRFRSFERELALRFAWTMRY